MSRIEQFEKLLAGGQDSALLRFSLGNEYLGAEQPAQAAEHLRRAVEHDPDYSAAWNALGSALQRADDPAAAAEAYRAGIEAANRRGDKQIARQMGVYLKRLEKGGR